MPKLHTLALVALFSAAPSAAQAPATQEEPAPDLEIVVTSDYLRMNWARVQGEVRFGDLDLATDKGADTFRSRVRAEANRLCGRSDSSLRSKADLKTCTDSISASADPQVEKLVAVARAK